MLLATTCFWGRVHMTLIEFQRTIACHFHPVAQLCLFFFLRISFSWCFTCSLDGMAGLSTRWMGMCMGETGVNDCQSEDTLTQFRNLFHIIATVRRGSHWSFWAMNHNQTNLVSPFGPSCISGKVWWQPSKVQSLTIYRLKEAERSNNNSSNDDDKTSKKKKKKKKQLTRHSFHYMTKQYKGFMMLYNLHAKNIHPKPTTITHRTTRPKQQTKQYTHH